MKRERWMGLAHRMLNLLDTGTTELAPATYEVPVSRYASHTVHEGERREIWGKTPMFLGMSNEIPKAGDWFARDIVDTPFLAVRHKDGGVRLYLNACRHRGVKVALGHGGNAKLFVCRFHAWCYDHDGKLVGVPEPEGFTDMDRALRGLVELPVAEKYGMIFGCATPGAAFDIDDVLGGLGPELGEYGFENYTIWGEPHVHEVQGNWKIAWDTFCENYHFASLHGQTLGPLLHAQRMGFDRFGKNARVLSAWKSIDVMRQAPEEEWDPSQHLSAQYRLYPAVNFTVMGKFMAVYWIMPGRDPLHAQGLHITYVPRRPADGEETAALDKAVHHGCQNVVQNEDFWITEQAAAAVRSPARPDTFVIGRNEPALQHFNQLFAEAVGAE